MRLALVYQGAIANVFDVSENPAPASPGPGRRNRITVGESFSAAEQLCRGAIYAGAAVQVYHCDTVEDVRELAWNPGPGTLFQDAKDPPVTT